MVQSCFTLALKYEKAARVSMINTSQIAWGFLVQVMLLNEPTNQYSIVGACLGMRFFVKVTNLKNTIIKRVKVFVSAMVVGMRKVLTS